MWIDAKSLNKIPQVLYIFFGIILERLKKTFHDDCFDNLNVSIFSSQQNSNKSIKTSILKYSRMWASGRGGGGESNASHDGDDRETVQTVHKLLLEQNEQQLGEFDERKC